LKLPNETTSCEVSVLVGRGTLQFEPVLGGHFSIGNVSPSFLMHNVLGKRGRKEKLKKALYLMVGLTNH